MNRNLYFLIGLLLLVAMSTMPFLGSVDANHLEWCDDIYHRNVSCPEYGNVEVPVEVLATEEAQHLEWCEQIGHENAGCPEWGSLRQIFN